MRSFNKSNGFSLIELLIVVVVMMVVAAIAIPNLLSSRRSANEASALKSVRTMSEAEAAYRATLGGQNYGTAAELYTSHLIDNSVAAANNLDVGGNPARNTPKSGYRFRIQVTAFVPGTGVASTYVISAIPVSASGFTQTGTKRICLTDNGILKSSTQNLSTHYSRVQCGFANAFVP